MSPRIKFFAFLAVGSFVAMIALSVLGAILQSRGWHPDPEHPDRIGYLVGGVFVALFLLLAFSLVPLMIRLFVSGQARIGNRELGLIQLLAAHERGAAYAIWALWGTGLAIATPFMLHDLFGVELRLPVGKSEGVLVADVGMTLDEIRQRSSLQLPDAIDSKLTGEHLVIGSPVFDFEIAGSAIRFERCRYYWIETGEHGDLHVESMNIGVSTNKVTRAELVAANQRVQQQLVQDGWEAGQYNYKTPELQALHGGITSSGHGYFWRKGGTLLRLVGKRMDDEKPGEDPETAGEWIQYVDVLGFGVQIGRSPASSCLVRQVVV
jgi:hypothetical protein